MRNVLDKSCGENQNTHFVFSKFFSENHFISETMWKTNTKFIVAFSQQGLLHEGAT
jgi:hypothetical protein